MNTVKRKAEKGDKIVVIKPIFTKDHSGYNIGDIFTVQDVYTSSVYTTTGLGLCDEEYRVVIDR